MCFGHTVFNTAMIDSGQFYGDCTNMRVEAEDGAEAGVEGSAGLNAVNMYEVSDGSFA